MVLLLIASRGYNILMEAVGIALQKRSFFNVTREESVGVTKEELV